MTSKTWILQLLGIQPIKGNKKEGILSQNLKIFKKKNYHNFSSNQDLVKLLTSRPISLLLVRYFILKLTASSSKLLAFPSSSLKGCASNVFSTTFYPTKILI
jgi:hypothetical protein